MKNTSSLALAVAVSLSAAQALHAADPAKKAPAKQVDLAAGEVATPEGKAPAVQPSTLPETVAVVEGTEIKRAELEEALAAMLAQSGRGAGEIPAEQKAGAYRMVLDDLIIDRLITKRAADIKVEDAQVEETFKKATANIGSDEEIKVQIEKSGQTVEKVKANIRSSLKQQQWVEKQIGDKDAVADAELAEFYKKNPEQFKMPEQVRASHILVNVAQDAAPEVVVAKQKEAEALLARVKKGEDFAAIAKEKSEDPSAKENSGDLDFFTKDRMVPEFSEQAFKMKKDEVSAPVRSQFGFHIIKLTDRKAPETMELEQAKPRLLAYLKQQKKQAEVEKLVREMREKAEVKVNLPAPAPVAAPTPGAPNAPAAPAPAAAPVTATTPPVQAPAAPSKKK